MQTIHTPAYRKSFIQYLRRGTPISLSFKADERPTTQYIWRTTGDDKVRSSHAANNGKIFSWNNPPETGHPGEDYGCRCWAEPYMPRVNEFVKQEVISIVDEGLYKWQWYDFVLHYYFGEGESIELWQVGHLQNIINRAQERGVSQVFEKVEEQILSHARKILTGSLYDTYNNSYDFSTVSFIHGDSKVKGSYKGVAKKEGDAIIIKAIVDYNFEDRFTDPLSVRERNTGTSTPPELPPDGSLEGEYGGKWYFIYGSWKTEFNAVIDEDVDKSAY